MKVLVTGANGFIGSFLVEKLVVQKYEVWCLVRKTSNLRWIGHLPVHLVYGELDYMESLEKAVDGMDYIYHVAGVTKARNEAEYFRVNFQGTVNLLLACQKANSGIKKFVLVSSLAAAGPSKNGRPVTEWDAPHPITPYGKSKLKAEETVLRFQDSLPTTIVRLPAVYGPRDKDVLEMFKYIKKRIKPFLGKEPKYVSLIHIKDLVDGLTLAGEKEAATGKLYFLANDKFYSWQEIENEIEKALHVNAITLYAPELLLDMIVLASEGITKWTGQPALLNRYKALEMKQKYWICDNSRAKKELGFTPRISLSVGMRETAQWYLSAGWL